MITPVQLRVLRGPNVFAAEPLIHLSVAIEPGDAARGELARVIHALAAHVPALRGAGEAGDVAIGAWFGPLLGELAMALQQLAGFAVGNPRAGGPGDVLFPYDDEEVGLEAARVALAGLAGLLPDRIARVDDDLRPVSPDEPTTDLQALVADFLAYARRRKLGPSTASLVEEARSRGIPVQRLGRTSAFQLGWGSAQRRIQATVTGQSSYLAVELAQDKLATCRLLGRFGLPVPVQAAVDSAEEAVRAAESIGYPVAVKPADLSKGRGISLDLRTAEAVAAAWITASELSANVLVETFFGGRDYRVLVVGDAVIAVAERVPAHVVGDGVRTIEELITAVNEDPRRGEHHDNVLTRLELTPIVRQHLAESGLAADSVPAPGRVCSLCLTANLSTGGTAIDRTDEIHRDNALVAVRAARQIGLDVAGIDLVCPDIARSIHETGGGIVEVNAAPGFRMHLSPSENTPRNVAAAVIDHMFGAGSGRVPLVAITGTNGKTTTTKLVAHLVATATGKRVGHTSSVGVYIGEDRIDAGDCSGPRSARILLGDGGVDAIVLETARGGLLREGLAFDVCDVGCVLNVSADHLGLKGIHTVEDLAAVKAVVVRSVGGRGTSVLNADDPHCRAMATVAGGRVCWFALSASDFVRERLVRGERAAVYDDGRLVILDGNARIDLGADREFPVTMNGTARFNVANALAAAMIAYSLGIGATDLRAGLKSFVSSVEKNPGRCNLIRDGLPYQIVVDYAHNEAALLAITDFVLRQPHRRAIIVLMTAGDRRDDDIRRLGAIAAERYDVLIAKEDASRRGRAVGELADLMTSGALDAGMPPGAIVRAMSDDEAVERAFALAEPGDIVLLCLEEVDPIFARIDAERARWASNDAEARRVQDLVNDDRQPDPSPFARAGADR